MYLDQVLSSLFSSQVMILCKLSYGKKKYNYHRLNILIIFSNYLIIEQINQSNILIHSSNKYYQ